MDRENFNAIITRYLEKFELTNGKEHNEWFKWYALYYFMENFDLDVPDVYTMLNEATGKFSVLIDNNHAMPISGLKELARKEPEFVRDALRTLLAEDGGDLDARQRRAEQFVDCVNAKIEHYWPGSHLYPQSMRSAILLLAMNRPADNYILFWSRADNWAKYTEFGDDFGSGSAFSLPVFYRMCDELRSEIEHNEALKVCGEKRLAKAKSVIEAREKQSIDMQLNDDLHLLVYDIIYCATCYQMYQDIPCYDSSAAKKRIERAMERAALERLLSDALAAERALAVSDLSAALPPELTGHTVTSKSFGSGTVIWQSQDRLQVQFDAGEKTFIYPGVFLQKHLTPNEADAKAVMDSITGQKELARLRSAAIAARTEYENKLAAFGKKWSKGIHNDQINTDDQ